MVCYYFRARKCVKRLIYDRNRTFKMYVQCLNPNGFFFIVYEKPRREIAKKLIKPSTYLRFGCHIVVLDVREFSLNTERFNATKNISLTPAKFLKSRIDDEENEMVPYRVPGLMRRPRRLKNK